MNKKTKAIGERATGFGIQTIQLLRELKADTVTKPLIIQLTRSATSIGANYAEAKGASSRKDFRNKIHICKKEAEESKHWLEILMVAYPENKKDLGGLYQEALELTKIFQAAVNTMRESEKEQK